MGIRAIRLLFPVLATLSSNNKFVVSAEAIFNTGTPISKSNSKPFKSEQVDKKRIPFDKWLLAVSCEDKRRQPQYQEDICNIASYNITDRQPRRPYESGAQRDNQFRGGCAKGHDSQADYDRWNLEFYCHRDAATHQIVATKKE